MADRITQQQLESYLWGAATLLRGTIDAGDYKQYIFPLLFFKRVCDVFDEETSAALKESGGDQAYAMFPEQHRFQVPTAAHWRDVRNVTTHVGQALQKAMRAIETANQEKLLGIFGDAQWTNKDRLSDEMLRDLVEHFSRLNLSVANLPEDELGNGYEYLIKKFADDSGHTAAEFYTNRTVVHLMTELLEPQPGESIYDPTCGTGGMLLSAIAHLRRQGKEWRSVKLYGQERNLMTSSIARMNCFLHGSENFRIERGDTLSEPKFHAKDGLKTFDVVLANPPYSIKAWDRAAFAADPWGRNLFGVPPQGRADYAFQQHIFKSMDPKTGRCAVLWPHGVLFRQEESEIRNNLLKADLIECVIGLGPNLFYNSPMEACILVCQMQKPKARKGKILFINAVNEVTRERAQSFLTEEHILRILNAYRGFQDKDGFTKVASLEEVRKQNGTLSIPLYVTQPKSETVTTASKALELGEAIAAWIESAEEVREALKAVLDEEAIPDMPEITRTASELPSLLDRSGWKRVRFGDVVENLNETEYDPVGAGLDRFIAMEHLEPGSLHVRSWGNSADGTTFNRRCRPGQVLFGKRRAYQRKVAVAEFEAVVSGDIYVMTPKNECLLPELLPFICLSEQFYQHAVGTSAGSLSPRTNWSSLASFEFDLPPLEKQRRIAQIMWSTYNTIAKSADISRNLSNLFENRLAEEFRDRKQDWPSKALGDIARVERGKFSHRPRNLPEFYGGEFPFVQTGDIQNANRYIRNFDYKLTKLGASHSKSFPPGTIFISIAAVIGATAISEDEVYATDSVVGTVVSKDMDIDFVELFLRSKRAYLNNQVATQTAQKNINLQALRPLQVPCPPRAKQAEIARHILLPFVAVNQIREYIGSIQAVLSNFGNAVFGGRS